jgi:flagellar hook-associated protein 2
MPALTSAGLGSGLNVGQIVTQLVAVERDAADRRIATEETRTQSKLASYASVTGALAGLTNALAGLKSGSALTARAVTSSNATSVTGSASSNASVGSYRVSVTRLASAQRIASTAIPAVPTATTQIGADTLTIAVGGVSFSLTVSAENSTLNGIRDLINNSSDNTGVSASVITTSGGPSLVLAARDSGAAKTLSVTSSSIASPLSMLYFDPLEVDRSARNVQQVAPAQDARMLIDGTEFLSATNRFTTAIEGVALTANAEGTDTTITVSRDADAARRAIEAFVSSFNSVNNATVNATRYDADTRRAAPLNGESTARSVLTRLRSVIGAVQDVSGSNIDSLNDLGVSITDTGTLSINSTTLSNAIANNPTSVALWVKDFATRVDTAVKGLSGSTGSLTSRTAGLQKQLDSIDTQRAALDARMAGVEARYRARFTALDGLVAGLRSTSDFLTRQFAQRSSN